VAKEGFEVLMAGKDHVIAGHLKEQVSSGCRIRIARSAGRSSAREPIRSRLGR